MKQTVFFMLAVMALVACKQEDVPVLAGSDQAMISLNFEKDVLTRAFFDPEATPETWESSLSGVQVLCYSSSELISSRALTPQEIASKSALISLPFTMAHEDCHLFVVANTEVNNPPAQKEELLQRLAGETVEEYNSTFDVVSGGSVKSSGFTMAWNGVIAMKGKGEVTPVKINLERMVAKIAVRTRLSADFQNKYTGKLIITETSLSNMANSAYLFNNNLATAPELTFSQNPGVHSQEESYGNLFYAFRLQPTREEEKLVLCLKGYYDQDGDLSTTTDRKEVEYFVVVEGSGNGMINRNCYYRLDLTVKGLNGLELETTITVLDWTTGEMQEVGLGL